MIDLHVHTRCSDGALTPTELVRRAHVKSVTALAVTDHDTCAGNDEAQRIGRELGVEIIPGVEFSVHWGRHNFHLLGYGTARIDTRAQARFVQFAEERVERLGRIVARLNDQGIPLSSREVRKEAGGEVIGRLHIARAMKRLGYIATVQEAFVRFLGRDGAAYVDRPRLALEEAVTLIRAMGGVAVLAHPGVFEKEAPGQLDGLLGTLIECGLEGLEAYYARHDASEAAHYAELAKRHALLCTGGSDFHRPPPHGPELGAGRLPLSCYERLRERLGAA